MLPFDRQRPQIRWLVVASLVIAGRFSAAGERTSDLPSAAEVKVTDDQRQAALDWLTKWLAAK